MAETLPNGVVIPVGADLINSNGVQAMRNLGSSADSALANRAVVGHIHDDRYYTEAEVDSKLATREAVEAVELGTEDLNAVTTPGKYYQSQSSEATTAANYPVGSAGSLRVKANAARTQVQQFYTRFSTSSQGSYWRVFYNGVWSQWWQVVESTDPRLSDARTPLAHTHAQSDVTGLADALAGKSSIGHTHDDRYYTEAETDSKLGGKVDLTDPRLSDARTPLAHTHTISDVSGLQAALDGKADTATTVTDSDVASGYDAYMLEMGA